MLRPFLCCLLLLITVSPVTLAGQCLNGQLEEQRNQTTGLYTQSACFVGDMEAHLHLKCLDASPAIVLRTMFGAGQPGECYVGPQTHCVKEVPLDEVMHTAHGVTNISMLSPTVLDRPDTCCPLGKNCSSNEALNEVFNFVQVWYQCQAEIDICSDQTVRDRAGVIKLGGGEGEGVCSCDVRAIGGSQVSPGLQLSLVVAHTLAELSQLGISQAGVNASQDRNIDLHKLAPLSATTNLTWDYSKVGHQPVTVKFTGKRTGLAYLAYTVDNPVQVKCRVHKPANKTTATAAPDAAISSTTANVSASTTVSYAQGKCPDGWVSHEDQCYVLLKGQNRNWRGAFRTCLSCGAELLDIHTEEQLSWVQEWLKTELPYHSSGVWMGLYQQQPSGDWFWPLARPFNASAFNDPSMDSGDCGYLKGYGDLGVSSQYCWKSSYAVCQMSTQKAELDGSMCTAEVSPKENVGDLISGGNSTAQSVLCPEGWVERLSGHSCYKFVGHKEASNYSQARDKCGELGAWLVNVDSLQEKQWLFVEVELRNQVDGDDSQWWTGLHKEERGWVWGDCRPMDPNLTPWRKGEPNFANDNEFCGELTWDALYNDHDCTNEFPFICEMDKQYAAISSTCPGPVLAPLNTTMPCTTPLKPAPTTTTTASVTTTTTTTTKPQESTTNSSQRVTKLSSTTAPPNATTVLPTSTSLPTKNGSLPVTKAPATSASPETSLAPSGNHSAAQPADNGGGVHGNGSKQKGGRVSRGELAGVLTCVAVLVVIAVIIAGVIIKRRGSPCVKRDCTLRVPYSSLVDEFE